MPTIVIPYKPREAFKKFHAAGKRWNVLIVHRRAGKTVAAINHLIRDCLKTSNANFAYICPTYTQAKRIAWDYTKEYTRDIPSMKWNESELKAEFPNGSKLYLLGAERPDSLRGLSLWGAVFDEYSQQPANIFTEIVRPALADHQGYAVWIGTPKGFNELASLYRNNENNEEWFRLLLRASESGILPEQELESLRDTMSPEEYAQEMECSFEAFIKGGVYQGQLNGVRAEKRITTVPYDNAYPVDTFWDLGISDATAIIIAQRIGKEVHILDTIEGVGHEMSWYARELQRKNYVYGKHYLPHDAAAREKGTGLTCQEVLEGVLGRNTTVIVPNLSVEEGIEATRRLFPSLWFDAQKTASLLDALTQYQYEWDDARGMFKKNPKHDWTSHFADALRYLSIAYLQHKQEQRIVQFIPNYGGKNSAIPSVGGSPFKRATGSNAR